MYTLLWLRSLPTIVSVLPLIVYLNYREHRDTTANCATPTIVSVLPLIVYHWLWTYYTTSDCALLPTIVLYYTGWPATVIFTYDDWLYLTLLSTPYRSLLRNKLQQKNIFTLRNQKKANPINKRYQYNLSESILHWIK